MDRVLHFTIPSRDARGRVVRLGPVLDLVQSAHDYPPPIRKLVAPEAGEALSDDFEPEIALLLAQYRHLEPFPENLAVLQQLKARGVPPGILSNGDAGMLSDVTRSAGFDSLLDHVISVDAVRRFKTHPSAYALGETTLGLPAKDILFVSSNAWDALGATWFGYQTVWVNRAGLPFEELGTRPSHTGNSLRAVLDFFPADNT